MAASDYGRELARLEEWNETLREALDNIYHSVDVALAADTTAGAVIGLERLFLYLKQIREAKELPISHTRARAIQLLETRWREHMDDNSINAHTFSTGLASMAFAMGAITDVEAGTYVQKIKHCPVDGDHSGDPARVWCGYCGDLTPNQPTHGPGLIPKLCRACNKGYDVRRDGVGVTVDQHYGYCSEQCARAYVRKLQRAEIHVRGFDIK